MNVFLSVIFLGVVILMIIRVYRAEDSLKKIFWPAIVIKTFAGMCVGLMYVFYYKEGDTLVFFSDGVRLANLARSDGQSYLHFLFNSTFTDEVSVELSFGDKRAIFMDKIVSLFILVSFDNYWLTTFYLTLISFFASWFLVRRVHHSFPEAAPAAVIAFLFFPSITFWTSGLIKETIAMAGLYFLCGVLVDIWVRSKVNLLQVVISLIAAFLLWKLKYYFAGIFFAIAGATLIYLLISRSARLKPSGVGHYILWLIIVCGLIAGVTLLHPNFRSHKLLSVMVSNYEAFVEFSKPEGVISFHNLEPTFASILANSPKAFFAGLYRPLFFDANNFLALLLSFENLILLGLSIIALRHVGQLFKSNVSILLCAIVVYVILLAIFITLSTPNLGTLARYRVGYLPFFVFLILLAPPIAVRLQKIINIPAKGN